MTTKPTQSQATRNVHLGFGLMFLSLVIFTIAFSWSSWRFEKKELTDNLSFLAEFGGKSVNSYFAHFESNLSILSQEILDANATLNLQRVGLQLKHFKEINPDIPDVYIADLNGQVLASANSAPEAALPNLSKQDGFIRGRNALLKGQAFYIGRPAFGLVVKSWIIPLRYGVRDQNGKLLYILNAPIALARQQSLWQNLHLSENTQMGLLRDDLYLSSIYPLPKTADFKEIYGKIRTGALAVLLRQQKFPQRGLAEGDNSVARADYDFAYYRLSNYPITFFVTAPVSNLQAIWWKHNQPFYLLTAIFLMGGFGVYYWTTKRQAKWEMEGQQQEEKLRSSEERFRCVISEAPMPIMIHAENGEVLEVNKAWTEMTGYSRSDLPTTRSWAEKAYRNQAQQVQQKINSLYELNHKVDQGEYVITCKDGNTRIWNFSAAPVGKLSDGRRYVISTAQDITDRKAAQVKVEFLAYHDALTGLPNRLLAKDHFELAMSFADREQTKVALVFLDLDNFKIINDSLGHAVGDALLKAVAARFKECLRDTDTLSRQGGDEFLIQLGGVPSLDAISHVAEKLQARLTESFSIEGSELSTSLSIGIAVYPNDGNNYDTLLKKADIAMYKAKEAGRTTYRFYAEQMNIDAAEHLQIRNHLRKGLESKEFVLHYQPQIDLVRNVVIGAEALIRWNHAELGMLPPGRFIPIAEESGLIVPIGNWVLLEACRQAVAWRNAGLPEMVIAVNLSAVQFKRGDLEKSVIQALTASGLPPNWLELELTESILIQDTESVLDTVNRLKSLGVKLSIDDFGTGYSSLSYLKSFAVDKLKIDQSFVRDMADDPNDAAIVRTIIQMAKNLNLKTIAEGVETERQADLLRTQGCEEAQGYHFARPMPAEEFERYCSMRQSAL